MNDHELLDNSSTVSVLFVEHESDIRNSCVERLSRSLPGLIVATTSDEAMAAANLKDIDILVTETDVAGEDGFRIISAVKEKNPSCLLVAISERKDAETFQKAIDARVDKFLVKPFTPEAMEDLLISLSHRVFVLKFYNEDAYYDGLLDTDDYTSISNAIDLIKKGIEYISEIEPCGKTIEANKALNEAKKLLKATLKKDD